MKEGPFCLRFEFFFSSLMARKKFNAGKPDSPAYTSHRDSRLCGFNEFHAFSSSSFAYILIVAVFTIVYSPSLHREWMSPRVMEDLALASFNDTRVL